jgi:hypothetical protein
MKTIISIMLAALTLYACQNKKSGNAEQNATTAEKPDVKEESQNTNISGTMMGRYGIKSARVVTETKLLNDMGVSEVSLYFDDYGAASYSETETKLKMKGIPASPKEFSITKGEYIYSWKEGAKTGTKMNLGKIKDVKFMDFEKLTEAMLKEMNIKKGGTETFLGKTCNVIEVNSETMGKGRILTWMNIPMLSDMTTMGMKVRAEVKELEENASIDRGKFELPVGVEFKEMDFNFKDNDE